MTRPWSLHPELAEDIRHEAKRRLQAMNYGISPLSNLIYKDYIMTKPTARQPKPKKLTLREQLDNAHKQLDAAQDNYLIEARRARALSEKIRDLETALQSLDVQHRDEIKFLRGLCQSLTQAVAARS